jgi:hypothetical protein
MERGVLKEEVSRISAQTFCTTMHGTAEHRPQRRAWIVVQSSLDEIQLGAEPKQDLVLDECTRQIGRSSGLSFVE